MKCYQARDRVQGKQDRAAITVSNDDLGARADYIVVDELKNRIRV